MHKKFTVGKEEKHEIDFAFVWYLGLTRISVDGKTRYRKPFFLKLERSFEVGSREKHLVTVRFNIFDYFRNVLKVLVDGQDVTRMIDISEAARRRENPIDDAAAALVFVALVNLIFSVIGTLFVPYLHTLEVRLLLLGGALIYFLFVVQVLSGKRKALMAATVFFGLDSLVALGISFSAGGLLVRAFIFYYLYVGLHYEFTHPLGKLHGQ